MHNMKAVIYWQFFFVLLGIGCILVDIDEGLYPLHHFLTMCIRIQVIHCFTILKSNRGLAGYISGGFLRHQINFAAGYVIKSRRVSMNNKGYVVTPPCKIKLLVVKYESAENYHATLGPLNAIRRKGIYFSPQPYVKLRKLYASALYGRENWGTVEHWRNRYRTAVMESNRIKTCEL